MHLVTKIFLLSNKLNKKNVPFIPKLLWMVNRIVFTTDIPPKTNIHKSVTLNHNGMGVIINGNSIIKEDVFIGSHVLLGGNMGKRRVINNIETSAPYIEKNVFIGPGAKLLGPIHIGEGAQIGAGAVVIKDVPGGATVVGIPAKEK